MRKHHGPLVIILCALITACATSSIEKQGPAYRITVPTTALVLEFPSDGFKLEQADNSRPYYYLKNDKIGLNVSFNFERAGKCDSSASCRDYLSDKLKTGFPSKKSWRSSQIGDVYVSENMDGPVNGFNLNQKHMNAHFVRGGG